MTIIKKETFDNFDDVKSQLQGVDVFLCTLGTRVKVGEELFTKVDYEYPLNFARLAKELAVRHYGLLSSTGADATSMFLYMRTKGRVENACREVGLPQLTIYRPGLLLNRRGDSRFGEKVGAWIPGLSKIESADMGREMIEHAVAMCNIQMSEDQWTHNRVHLFDNSGIIADLRFNLNHAK